MKNSMWARRALLSGISMFAVGMAMPAQAQVFAPVGRSGPEQGRAGDLASFALPLVNGERRGTNAGGIVGLSYDPTNANRIFAASVNGGVWRTLDGGLNWTPLTDQMRSLSINSISMDATNSNTIIAGTGLSSTGAFNGGFNLGYQDRSAAALNGGLLITRDGGTSWSELVVPGLAGQSVSAVTVRGNTIMATGWELNAPTLAGGLFRSTDGGVSWSTITLPGSPSNSPVSSLVADPSNANTFYAAAVGTGLGTVYKSTDGGATWSALASFGSNAISIDLATGPGGTLAIYSVSNSAGRPNALVYSSDGGASFTSLNAALTTIGATGINNGRQGLFHSGIAIDPNNPSKIYIAGDSVASFSTAGAFYSPIFRVDGSTAAVENMTALGLSTGGGTPNTGTFTHADTHNLYFDPTGRLVAAGDGGVFRLSSTNRATGTWAGFDGTLQTKEHYGVAYDSRNKLIATASQDNGTAIQTSRDSGNTFSLRGGDGTNIQVNDTYSNGKSYVYGSSQNLGNLYRGEVTPGSADMVNGVLTFLFFNTTAGSETVVRDPNEGGDPPDFNRLQEDTESGGELRKFANENSDQVDAAGNPIPVYDPVTGELIDVEPISLHFTSPFVLNNIDQTKFAFGGTNIWVVQDNPTNQLGCFNANQCYDVLDATSVATQTVNQFTANAFSRVFTIDYGVVDAPNAVLAGGRNFVTLGVPNARVGLSTTGTLNSLTMFANYGQGAGDASNALQAQKVLFDKRTVSRIFVSDSVRLFGSTNATIAGITNANATFTDLTPNLPANFSRPLGMDFISKNGVNALVVGGINTVANAGNPLVVADSSATGVLSGWRRFGTGLPNAEINALEYDASVDVLAVSSYGRGSWLVYDTTTNFASATQLVFGAADNDSNPNASILNGNRPLIKVGTGTLNITGAATYTGPTTIQGGRLNLNGSILGNLTVNAGTTFGGNATVAGTVTNFGTIRPGNSPGIMNFGAYVGGGTIVTDVQFNNVAAPVNGTTHDFINITGNVTGVTTLSINPDAPSTSPVATTGKGVELVRVGGTVSSGAFTLGASPVYVGGFEYLLKYLPDYSGTLDGFFLQSASRQETALNAAMLSAGRASWAACARSAEASPNLNGAKGRVWAGAHTGTFNADGSTGVDYNSDHECYGGGVEGAAGNGWQIAFSGGFGTISADVNLAQGLATMKGDGGLLQASLSFFHGPMYATARVGYNQTSWDINGVHGLAFSHDVDGLIAGLTVGHEVPLSSAVKLTLSAALNYDGTQCGSDCLVNGSSEQISDWTGDVNARLDANLFGSTFIPYIALSMSTDFNGPNAVTLLNSVTMSDTQSMVGEGQIGFNATLAPQVSAFGRVVLTHGFDSDVEGTNFAGGVAWTW